MEIHSEISESHEITLSTDHTPPASVAAAKETCWMKQRTFGTTTSSLATAAAYTPPSASSSPSHEFTFTISLSSSSSSSTSSSSTSSLAAAKNLAHIKPKSPQAIDLTPADDIFFHGHLLPLRLLSSLPTSPRCSSTNSIDTFTRPVREPIQEIKPSNNNNNSLLQQHSHNGTTDSGCITSIGNLDRSKGCSFNSYEYNTKYHNKQQDHQRTAAATASAADYTPTGRIKAKTFSIFSLPKRRKDNATAKEGGGGGESEDKKHKRKTLRFELSQLFRKYMRAVRPRKFSKGKTESTTSNIHNTTNHQIHHRQTNCSSSGNLSPRRGGFSCHQKSKSFLLKRGQFSAPASMRTSPTNSGVLAMAPNGRNKSLDKNYSSGSSDSTMDELQAAIQAAITHCKNSIASQENLNC